MSSTDGSELHSDEEIVNWKTATDASWSSKMLTMGT